MANNHIIELQQKIIDGLEIAAKKLTETKKKNGQKIAVFRDGKIQVIVPE